MKKRNLWLTFLAVTFFALGVANEVPAYVANLSSDAELIALQNSGQFAKVFGGNVRWGNNATNGDWEYSVVDAGDFPIQPNNPKQIQWTAYNSTHTYSFSYSSATDTVSLGLTFTTPAYTAPVSTGAVADVNINALVIRARAGGTDTATLLNPITILFTGGGSLSLSGLVGDADANSIFIVDQRLAGGFTIDGLATLQDGSGSLPMYQFKAGTSPVPIPGAVWLLGSGLVGIVGLRRRLTR